MVENTRKEFFCTHNGIHVISKIWLSKQDLTMAMPGTCQRGWENSHRAGVLLGEEILVNPGCGERESQSPPGTSPDVSPNLKQSPLKYSMRNTK